MKGGICAGTLLLLATMARGEELLPTAIGTTWEYRMVQETGEPPALHDAKSNADSETSISITDRIDGMQDIGGEEFLQLVRRRAGVLVSTDLIAVNEQGIVVGVHAGEDGQTVAVDPRERILATPLKAGTKWTYNAQVAGVALEEQCEITGEEEIEVPAGKFHAYRIHCAPAAGVSSTIDRWFVVGIGVVKEQTTIRAPTGDLLQRTSLQLQKLPAVFAIPQVTAAAATGAKKLAVDVAAAPDGQSVTSFSSSAGSIFARWSGHGLRPSAKVRAVWIAEDVGNIAPPNYKIDEASTIATQPSSHGIFTLSRPESGWAEGKYRVEFYLDEILTDTVNLEIRK